MIVPDRKRRRHTAARLTAIVVVSLGLLFSVSSVAEAAWPTRSGPAYWPTVESGSFRFRVQPSTGDQQLPGAGAFQTEFGPVFASAKTLTNAILATNLHGPIDVYAVGNPNLFAAMVASRTTALTPHSAVILDTGSPSILVDVNALLTLSPTQVEDAIRNAVTQLLVHQVAGGAAPPGFAAGMGFYVELPTSEQLARLAANVQTAAKDNTLLTWFDLNRPVPDAHRAIALDQSYAAIAFLVSRYDIPAIRTFLTSLPSSTTWQEAMRAAFLTDAATIEQLWRDDLQRWTASGWRDNLMASFDLEPARLLLAQGQYVAAKALLDPSLNLYRQLNDPASLRDAQALMTLADTGIQAESLMTEVETALRAHDYSRAANLLDQAEIQYKSLSPDQVPQSLLATYRQMATDGLTALAQLKDADRMADSWGSYPEARSAARSAGATFARLGDDENRESAESVLNRLDTRQRRLVVLMGILGVITLAWLGLWLRARGPAELKWAH